MTIDSVFILFKKTDFDSILAYLGGKVYRWWGVVIFFLAKIWGHSNFFDANIFDSPPSEENASPLNSNLKQTKLYSMYAA